MIGIPLLIHLFSHLFILNLTFGGSALEIGLRADWCVINVEYVEEIIIVQAVMENHSPMRQRISAVYVKATVRVDPNRTPTTT